VIVRRRVPPGGGDHNRPIPQASASPGAPVPHCCADPVGSAPRERAAAPPSRRPQPFRHTPAADRPRSRARGPPGQPAARLGGGAGRCGQDQLLRGLGPGPGDNEPARRVLTLPQRRIDKSGRCLLGGDLPPDDASFLRAAHGEHRRRCRRPLCAPEPGFGRAHRLRFPPIGTRCTASARPQPCSRAASPASSGTLRWCGITRRARLRSPGRCRWGRPCRWSPCAR